VVAEACAFKPDAVVGIGGGSAMDMAKLIAVLVSGAQTVPEIIGIDKVKERRVRLIAVAATAGNGQRSHANRDCDEHCGETQKGRRQPLLDSGCVHRRSAVDAKRPAHVTAATGVDALTHCIEAYTNKNAHPIVDQWALEGIRLILANLERAVLKARTSTHAQPCR